MDRDNKPTNIDKSQVKVINTVKPRAISKTLESMIDECCNESMKRELEDIYNNTFTTDFDLLFVIWRDVTICINRYCLKYRHELWFQKIYAIYSDKSVEEIAKCVSRWDNINVI